MPSDSDSRAPPPGSETHHLNEERLRLAVEATGLGTWDLDPLTGTLLWDERCKALFGVPPEASLDYDTFLSLVHPDDRERVHQAVQRSLSPSGGGSYRLDYRCVNPRDGRIRWLSTSGRAFFDPARSRAVRFLGTVLDITDRVLAREAAEHERGRVTTLLESISEAFEAFDRDWRFLYVNREAERILGRPREELLGRDHWELYPDTLGTALEHHFRRAASERIPLAFENHYAPWDRWFEVRLYPTDEGVAVLFQDITERKRRDEERERLLREQTLLREQAEKALRERQRAVEVLEHGEALVVVDKDFRILLVNEHQERLSQTRREDTLGRILWEVFPSIAHPESSYWREYHRVMRQKVPVQFEEYYPPLELWVGKAPRSCSRCTTRGRPFPRRCCPMSSIPSAAPMATRARHWDWASTSSRRSSGPMAAPSPWTPARTRAPPSPCGCPATPPRPDVKHPDPRGGFFDGLPACPPNALTGR